jgi:cytochrome P450
LFEKLGGKAVTDNNRLIDYSHSQARAQTLNRGTEKQFEGGQIDLMSRLVNAEDKKTRMRPSLADLGNECLNTINAGADPFSGVLAGAFFYLTHNIETLQKVTEEVRYGEGPYYCSQLLTRTQIQIQFSI